MKLSYPISYSDSIIWSVWNQVQSNIIKFYTWAVIDFNDLLFLWGYKINVFGPYFGNVYSILTLVWSYLILLS